MFHFHVFLGTPTIVTIAHTHCGLHYVWNFLHAVLWGKFCLSKINKSLCCLGFQVLKIVLFWTKVNIYFHIRGVWCTRLKQQNELSE